MDNKNTKIAPTYWFVGLLSAALSANLHAQASVCPQAVTSAISGSCTLSIGDMTITATGSINNTTATAITIDSGNHEVTLSNYGTICGTPIGIRVTEHSTNVTIINYGAIEGTDIGIEGHWPTENAGVVSAGGSIDCSL